MSLRKSDEFITDVELQFEWYVIQAGWEIGENYLQSVESTCRLIEQHPLLGPRGGFSDARLAEWRFFLVFAPFQKHVLFFEIIGEDVVMRRAMHGSRNLQNRLLEPPQAG